MKKLFRTSLAVLIGLSLTVTSCKKSDSSSDENNGGGGNNELVIPQEQRATVFYFGGTWCGPCGAYGKPAKEKIHKEAGEKAVIISSQVTDEMSCADGNTLASMFNPSGVPAMYIGGHNETFVAMIGGSTQTGTQAMGYVNGFNAKSAIVNTVLSLKEDQGLINVNIDGKFFEKDSAATYFMAGYMLEDSLVYTQYMDASNEKNVHYNVIRTKFGTNILGDQLAASPAKGDKFNKQMNFFIDTTKYKKSKCAFAIVIWRKDAAGGLTASNSNYIHMP